MSDYEVPLLNNIKYCHNLSIKKLMKWYEEAITNKALIQSVISLMNEKIKIDDFDRFMSDIVNNVLLHLNECAKEGRIDELLRFDPYYVR